MNKSCFCANIFKDLPEPSRMLANILYMIVSTAQLQ